MHETDLIQSVIAVERQAKAMTGDARLVEENLDASVEAEIRQLRQHYQAEAESYLKQLEDREQSRRERELRAQDQKLAARMERIERIYQSEKDRWADQLFRRIVGTEDA